MERDATLHCRMQNSYFVVIVVVVTSSCFSDSSADHHGLPRRDMKNAAGVLIFFSLACGIFNYGE